MKKLLIILIIFFCSSVFPQGKNIVINEKFFSKLKKVDPLLRDNYLKGYEGFLCMAKGTVKSIDESTRFGFKNRVIITGNTKRKKIHFIYYIFFNRKNSEIQFSKELIFNFKGQIMAFTPVDSRRDKYIVDIILKEASINVD